MAYQPIQNYGIVGNMRTAALVAPDGSIDWLCLPHFDSPSVFAAILDDQKGGRFSIRPAREDITHKQLYWPETNVLITRFLSDAGVAEITDFMPLGGAGGADDPPLLVRRVHVVRGDFRFHVLCQPAFNYARDRARLKLTDSGALFENDHCTLHLASTVKLGARKGRVECDFPLHTGESAVFALRLVDTEHPVHLTDAAQADRLLEATVHFWHHWLSQCTYTGRWREMVHRSALVLKLLTFEPTGAIVASPTCSLPEKIGGGRNWDYRYTWIRDAAFTIYALMRIGFTEEAASFMGWLEQRCHELNPGQPLQIMYGIRGEHELTEQILPHLEGYRGSAPVRIGNGAHRQLQLDIYGELLDSVYLYNKYGSPISYELWTYLRKLVNWVCDNWDQRDEGIWEVRSGRKDFVYSKLMCWVALDRALRLAEKRSFPAERERWLNERDAIYEQIMRRGWSARRKSFVQAYGEEVLDASNLIMPLVFFVSPTDPRMLQTLDAIMRFPEDGGLVSDSLVYRYDPGASPDGLEGDEGTFNMCTFWLVEALTRAGRVVPGHLRRARLIFEQMLGYANHLGLYGEQTGRSGEALGNFPQAFTHLALISAAFNLDRTLGARGV
ncbi:MAG TPA: glycoside hydrolase family 15 protein [Gemmataceae bacterium]